MTEDTKERIKTCLKVIGSLALIGGVIGLGFWLKRFSEDHDAKHFDMKCMEENKNILGEFNRRGSNFMGKAPTKDCTKETLNKGN